MDPFLCKKFAKPKVTISETSHKFLNHTFYYPGAITWNAIDIKMVDPGGDPDTAATLAAIVTAAGYKPPTKASNEDMTSMSKAKAVGALGTIVISQIDSDGKPVESWTLWNAWVQEVDFGGTLEYGTDTLNELNLKVRYDWARINTVKGSSARALQGTEFFQS